MLPSASLESSERSELPSEPFLAVGGSVVSCGPEDGNGTLADGGGDGSSDVRDPLDDEDRSMRPVTRVRVQVSTCSD